MALLVKVANTRWLSLGKALKRLGEKRKSVAEVLEEGGRTGSTKKTRERRKSQARKCHNLLHVAGIAVARDCLSETTDTLRTLQMNDDDVHQQS